MKFSKSKDNASARPPATIRKPKFTFSFGRKGKPAPRPAPTPAPRPAPAPVRPRRAVRPPAASSGGRAGILARLPNPLVPRDSEAHFQSRMRFVVGTFLLSFALLAIRALDLTILQGDTLRERAESQHKKKVAIPGVRGRILDRHGRTMATSLPVKTVSLDRDRMGDPVEMARWLGPLLDMPADVLEKRLRRARPGSYPVLKRRISPDVVEKIQTMEESLMREKAARTDEEPEGPALFFVPEVQRFYPLGELIAHVIGFVDFDGLGVEGLERSFETVLRGRPGSRIIVRDRLGRPMPQAQTLEVAQPGTDLVLTIDTTIQYVAYRALLKAMTRTKSKSGLVVVLDPDNGDVLAMVNQPGFNPNNLADSEPKDRRNRVVMDAFEPGSTFKVFTVAAALDMGVVRPDTLIDVEGGTIIVGGRRIRDTHKKNQLLSVSQILQKSSNVGAAKIGLSVGNERQEPYLYRFGFARPTGIELDYEASGRFPDIKHYVRVGLANRSFGQGISTTPIQLSAAAAAVVNGGLLHQPHLAAGRVINGRLVPQKRNPPTQVISEATSQIMRKILVGVVGPDGTAPQAAVDGYVSAGKTGTAQKASPTGGYAAGRYFSSFFGFVPADHPRLLIYVGLDEPQGQYYGGVVAAPVFKEIAQEVLPLLAVLPEIPKNAPMPPIAGHVFNPDQSKDQQPATDSLINMSLWQALEVISEKGIVPQVQGSGQVVRQVTLPDGGIRLELQ
ncbi:MAG: penicillin-binding protein 2 [Magnetococcus sp. DMHC-1]|nr:penicillin-binding protein 2 [Magnetococcales bacterium]